jgi:secreted trypsin-like serine protease
MGLRISAESYTRRRSGVVGKGAGMNHRRRSIVLLASALVLAAAVALPSAPAGAGPSPQIIGGDPAEPGEYPFMAAILNETISGDDYQKQFCGGSLVDDDWVLTAAHCVEDTAPSSLAVAVGRRVLTSTEGERRSVAQVFVHPSFGSPTSLAHDAALLRLSSPVTGITPIDLAVAADDAYEVAGTVLTVIGWGTTRAKGQPSYPDDLQEVDVPAVGDGRCSRVYGTSFHRATMLCAGGPGIDSCYGDSGGPLFARRAEGPVQLGVVSWGNGCATRRFPGVYSEVNNPSIRSWVTSYTGV